MAPSPSGSLLTVRAAVILLSALVAGVLAGTLSYLDGQSVPGAVFWGASSAGGVVVFLHSVVGR